MKRKRIKRISIDSKHIHKTDLEPLKNPLDSFFFHGHCAADLKHNTLLAVVLLEMLYFKNQHFFI